MADQNAANMLPVIREIRRAVATSLHQIADTCERLHLLLPFDATRAQEASDRAVAVIQATQAGELLPRLTDDVDDWRCKLCGHRERCWE
jgi:hypothetical protein